MTYLAGFALRIPQKSGLEFLPNGGSYGDQGERKIKSIIDSLVANEGCNRAFTIITGKSIKDIVDKGLVVGPASLLNNPANNSLTVVSEAARSAYSEQFAKRADAATIRNVSGQPFPFASRRDQRADVLRNSCVQ